MKRTMLAFLCCIFCATGAARAGTTGMLSGTVTDEAGKPVADVRVIIESPSDKESTQTDAHGHFTFMRLAPDAYTIATNKPGFRGVEYVGVTVFADNALSLHLRLEKRLVSIQSVIVRDYAVMPLELQVNGYIVRPWTMDGYPNPFAMSLSTIPGVLVGSGGSYMH